MTPEQCRAARAWLGLSQQELATKANVAKNTVYLFEAGLRTPTPNIIAALRRAIEAEGIRLLFDETGAAAGITGRACGSMSLTCCPKGAGNHDHHRP